MQSFVTSLLVAAIATSGLVSAAMGSSEAVLSGMRKSEPTISAEDTREDEQDISVAIIGGADGPTAVFVMENEADASVPTELPADEAEDAGSEDISESASTPQASWEAASGKNASARAVSASEEKLTQTVVPCRKWDQGENVEYLQHRLRTLGFQMKEIDDVYGANTVRCVKELQSYLVGKTGGVAWHPTGEVSQGLADELNSLSFPKYESTVSLGSKGKQVTRVQRRLYVLGFLAKNGVDSKFGEETEEAVTRFQRLCGIAQTGIADERTQNLLFSENAPDAEQERAAYCLKVDLSEQMVYAYGWSEERQCYGVLEREMPCTTGKEGAETPLGTYQLQERRGEWVYLRMYDGFARYVTVFNDKVLFHSVLFPYKGAKTPMQGANGALTEKVSKGSVRLSVEDAKWIYESCRIGTTIIVE